MRKRKWALFAFIIMIATIFISFESWRIFKANERLKYYILAELQPILGNELFIERVHVGFGNIHMHNVSFTVPGQHIRTTIKDFRVGYNFLNLLVRGFHPQYISQDVLLVEPEITITPKAFANRDSLQQKAPSASPRFLSDQLKELDMLNYISLKRGRVILEQNDTMSVILTHSLQGGIFRQNEDSLFINLIGSFLESQESNVTITGNADLQRGLLTRLDARLEHYDIANGIPFLNKEKVDVQKGMLRGDFHIFQNLDRQTFRLTGECLLQQAQASLFAGELDVEQMNAQFLISQDSLLIQSSDLLLNQSPVTVRGTISNLNDLRFDVRLESNQLALARFSHVLGESLHNQVAGQAIVRSRIRGPVNNLAIINNIWVKTLLINDLKLQNMRSTFTYQHGRLDIRNATAKTFETEWQLKGVVDLKAPDKDIEASLSGNLADALALFSVGIDSTLQGSVALSSDISGTLKNPLISGNWDIVLSRADNDSFRLGSLFTYSANEFRTLSTPQEHPFQLEAVVNLQTSPAAIQVEAERFEHLLAFLFNVPQEKNVLKQIRGQLSIDGSPYHMNISSVLEKISGGLNEGEFLRLDANLNQHENKIWSNAEFIINPLNENALHGKFDLEKTNEHFLLKSFEINDEFASSLHIHYDEQTIDGSANATNLDIARLTAGLIPSLEGIANGSITLGGELDAPQMNGSLTINNILYHELGPYDIVSRFAYDSTRFNLQKFLLNHNNSTLLLAEGSYATQSNNVDVQLKGAGFDVGSIYSVTGRDTLLTGETLVNLRVSGSPQSPQINGVLAIQNGKILNIPFDEMELLLGQNGRLVEKKVPRLWIDKFRITRFNEYELLTSGYFPFRQTDSLYFDVDGSGNFFTILKDIDSFFRQPKSHCTVKARVRGTPVNPVLDEAHVIINDASLEFGSVVPPISEVNGEVHLNLVDQFVDLSFLKGKMGGKPFFIYNEHVEKIVSAKPLQDMRLPDNSLNFGVLVLETPKRGVPLSFVGLMEPNEYGHLELLGREEGEKFYFAGLGDGLTLRGRINLYETEIMYPFYEGAGGASSGVKEFLENLTWDLLVVPVKNTRFVRNFPGAIDEVYVNLKLDERYGGLGFSGRLADDSFRINGTVRSTKGFMEYLDMNFRVEQVGVEFDRSSLIPVAYGQARTTVTDSLGISSTILLTLQTVDNTMDKKSVDDIVRQEEGRARFDQIRFKLSSDNPNIGVSEAQIMASLGYSASNFQNSALEAIGYGTDNLILRPIFRPVERELEQTFGFDYVRFSSQFTRNIIQFNLNNNIDLNNRLSLLESTKIIVGKYLANRFFIQYTGQIESGVGYRYKVKDLGLHHTVGLEYQINPQLFVELEYDYDSLMLYNRDDKRVVLRHWFPF